LGLVYDLRVCVIPTNRPCRRQALSTRVFLDTPAKYTAIVAETQRLQQAQRSVLIGTPSVDASEALSRSLREKSIEHVVLNARFPDLEAEIVADAGARGRVTIATNMAGRGTDILLQDLVRERGGLHVIATERHTSKRIDRQLVGRSARQGDPGSYQFFLALDDELLQVLPAEKRQSLVSAARANSRGELDSGWVRTFERIQRSLERMHVKQRKLLLKHERELEKRARRIGLDPYLELAED
jgi:preprotein translocase subunit SecA